MTKFTDGPAAGSRLSFSRVPMPFFLRVVRSAKGKIDALDKLSDVPAADETIFVYRKIASHGTCHTDGRDAKTGKRFGTWGELCDYALNENQPDDATARDAEKWPAWCKAEHDRIKAEKVSQEKEKS